MTVASRAVPLCAALALAAGDLSAARAEGGPDAATAFHYGAAPPVDLLAFYPRVVLDPERVPPAAVRELAARGSAVLGRLRCPRQSAVAALGDRARTFSDQGFRGVLVEPQGAWTPVDIAELVHAIHVRWPVAAIVLEGSPASAAHAVAEISGLVAGPLFSGWDPTKSRYVPVAEDLRHRRVDAMRAFARTTGLPVVDVEALPAGPPAAARALAAKVTEAGFLPWVATGARDRMGVGTVEPVARRVLVVIDSAEEPYLPYTLAHRLVAVPLEYLGFAVDYLDVRAGLPDRALAERYAGIVTWFTDDEMPSPERYEGWLTRQMDAGLRVAVMGHLGFAPTEALLRRLRIQAVVEPPRPPLRVAAADSLVGFEAAPAARGRELPPYTAPGLIRHLQIVDADGHAFSPIVEADWGGMALDPYLTESGFEGRQRWIVDPFRFLSSALALPDIPVPDPTTENGRRLMEIHIDGDGFISFAELPHHPLAGEVIRRDFLSRYHLPTTVSIIEGEIGPSGLYRDRTAELEPVARAIFALPEVEVASHTFSHPFDWLRAQGVQTATDEGDEPDAVDGDRLDIPGYQYSVEREVDGSVHYIDQHLTPAGKSTRVFLWSGNALPPEEAIARADALGLENMNGDNAEEPGPTQTLATVPSFARPVGDHLQIYAPAQNENVFTNLWHGPYYGFRRVIDYFKFTDAPRRLKPIGIYYHFYSGTKTASVSALHEVYEWALSQETVPVWVSEYTAHVRGFERATLARRLDGTWLLRDFGALRTVRLPAALGWPDLPRSPDVVGVRELPQGRYVSLGPGTSPTRTLALRQAPPDDPHIESANAAVVSWRRDGAELWFALRGHMPAEVTVGGCAPGKHVEVVEASGGDARPKVEERRLRFEAAETGEVHVVCR
jgi:polysaccharide biosynthesis protein PelA